jgi:hypothetical protein
VQADEVLSIESHDDSIVGGCQTDDGLVGERPSGHTHVGNGHDVVAELAQRFDHRQRKFSSANKRPTGAYAASCSLICMSI